MALEIDGVIVLMSEGLYAPYVQVSDPMTREKSLCDYGSRMARDAGLANPKHWAHAVYGVLLRTCRDHQAELQGGSMAAYEETRADRDEAERARRRGNS